MSYQQSATLLSKLISDGKPLHFDALPQQDRPRVMAQCYGVCRQFFLLDAQADALLRKPFKEKDSDILAVLLLGLYQLQHSDKPDYAILSTCVETCRHLKKPWATGLINGVLRNFLRNPPSFESNEEIQLQAPDWLIDTLKETHPQDYQTILTTLNQPAPLTLRINRQQTTRKSYATLLCQENIEHHLCEHSADGIRLTQFHPIETLPRFKEGWFSIQDESAQRCIEWVNPQPNQRILDACSAPGGKLCHLLEHEPTLQITALDIHQRRLQTVQENLQRLQLPAVNCITADATNLDSWWDGELFDTVLLDAPCSASGVIKHHPDIKLRLTLDEVSRLCQQQSTLLDRLWQTLKPGGKLVYMTCSILLQENTAQLNHFIDSQAPDATLKNDLQIQPSQQHDGFYFALLTKNPR